jgi:aspartate aminotransferase
MVMGQRSAAGVFKLGVFKLGVFKLGVFRLGVFRLGVFGTAGRLSVAGVRRLGDNSARFRAISFLTQPLRPRTRTAMFEAISAAPPDPILGLGEAFQKDTRTGKINLSIGVYQDEHGRTPVLDSVKKAEARLLTSETTKGYLGIEGLKDFTRAATELSLGGLLPHERVAAVQSPGGTGALRIAADFLAVTYPHMRVWFSNPTWPNHLGIFQRAGLETKVHPYLSNDKTSLDMTGLLDTLEREARPGDAICLHGCCHNPTGIDPTAEQWSEMAELCAQRGVLPILDFAYQGFGDGPEADRIGLEQIAAQHEEFFVCSSFSKNFGLYSERVGALLAVTRDADNAGRILSQLKQAVRVNYSNPPRHGAAVVATILGDAGLRAQWLEELAAMRQRIHGMRQQFVDGMRAVGCETDFSFLLQQKGMFSYSGLTPIQVDWLKSQKAIYMVGTGRINVAGITPANLPVLCAAIHEAIQQTAVNT